MKKKKIGNIATIVLLLFTLNSIYAQQPEKVSLQQSIDIALKNNNRVKAAKYNEQSKGYLSKSAYDLPKTMIDADYGQFNSRMNDTRFGISQSFNFPTVYIRQKKAFAAAAEASKAQTQLTQQEIKASVRTLYYELQWLNSKQKLLKYADSIYRLMEEKSQLRFKVGETNVLEKSASQSARQYYTNQLNMIQQDVDITLRSFNAVLQDSINYTPKADSTKITFSPISETQSADNLPLSRLWQHETEAAKWRWKTERARMLPDFNLGYNNLSITGNQTNAAGQDTYYDTSHRFSYITAGISIPLFFGSQSAKNKAAKAEYQNYEAQAVAVKAELSAQLTNAVKEVDKYNASLGYYETDGLANAQTIISAANDQLGNGDIDYLQWVMVVNQAITIKNEYLDTVNNYNKAVIALQTLTNL